MYLYLYAVSKHVVIVDCRPGCGRMAAKGKLDVGGRGSEVERGPIQTKGKPAVLLLLLLRHLRRK